MPTLDFAKPDGHRRADSREKLLAEILDPSRLPTPPGVALQIIHAASRPDCQPSEIVSLLALDAALCAKVLKAVNSCLYGLARPIASLERAVTILGLNPLRSMVLGLSLPAMRLGRVDESMHEYWVSSVTGAILARELAIHRRYANPEDDMVAGLLRDLGQMLLWQTYPDVSRSIAHRCAVALPKQVCHIEREAFGIDHADVTAELLLQWQLPEDVIEPIRHHHEPGRLGGKSQIQVNRAELLYFAEHLARLDTVTQQPEGLQEVLTLARERFDLPQPALVAFLEQVAPKVMQFAQLLEFDEARLPEFAAALATGSEALVSLTVEASRKAHSGQLRGSLVRTLPCNPFRSSSSIVRSELTGLDGEFIPDYQKEFYDRLPKGGCRLGSYVLREFLGRGAMGAVFKAYEPSLDRFVAVKVLAPSLAVDLAARHRFAREARIAASIRHENVVAIHAVQEFEGTAFLAMEYVEGGSLETLIDSRGVLAIPDVIRLATQIAAGLGAAHVRGVIHRDVKPANILVEADGERVKLTDFGLARVSLDGDLTPEGVVMGTPLFMSPEQTRGRSVDARSDLFSLGGVIYAMCTGYPPFPGDTLTSVFSGVCEREPVPPRVLRADIPEWLESVILRLLRKRPEDRFQRSTDVAHALMAQSAN